MSSKTTVKVWDLLVRIFHWSLVLFFIVAYASSEESEDIHEVAGYVVLGLISVRLIWGFVGSEYARFSNFIYAPKHVMEYVRSLLAGNPKHYLGHNPLGGLMVVALLSMLFVVTLSGVKLESIEEAKHETPAAVVVLAGDEDGDEEFWEEFHEASTNIMLGLIALHIAGVVISGRMHKENLVKAMITGNKER